ncbi:methyltransferase domain-containing protein [Actinoplanes sp. URMC 104]|uniref:methyltransferase domain-containing protein n=1 Tax=Actinoplanes sp. URMC 104 TaxID=3423409 RepID=UPI003F1DDF38
MDHQRVNAIARSHHPIGAPISGVTVNKVLRRAARRANARILELGCGQAAWAMQALAHCPDGHADAVDLNPYALERAEAAAALRDLADRLTLHERDARTYVPDGDYDLVLCVGATRAFGGFAGTLAAAGRHVNAHGVLIVGERFVEAPPSEWPNSADAGALHFSDAGALDRGKARALGSGEAGLLDSSDAGAVAAGDAGSLGSGDAVAVDAGDGGGLGAGGAEAFDSGDAGPVDAGGAEAFDSGDAGAVDAGGAEAFDSSDAGAVDAGDGEALDAGGAAALDSGDGLAGLTDLPGLVDAATAAGWQPIYAHVSDPAEWDDYEWSCTGSLLEWALDNPGHPDAPEAARAARERRNRWLRGYRGVLGFATLVLRRAS